MMATASCLRFALWFYCTIRPWRDWPAQALGTQPRASVQYHLRTHSQRVHLHQPCTANLLKARSC